MARDYHQELSYSWGTSSLDIEHDSEVPRSALFKEVTDCDGDA